MTERAKSWHEPKNSTAKRIVVNPRGPGFIKYAMMYAAIAITVKRNTPRER